MNAPSTTSAARSNSAPPSRKRTATSAPPCASSAATPRPRSCLSRIPAPPAPRLRRDAQQPRQPSLQPQPLRGSGRASCARTMPKRASISASCWSRLHSTLAHVLFDLGRSAEAEASSREVLCLRPDDPQAHLNMVSVLRVLGRPAEAAECCREALRLRPGSPRRSPTCAQRLLRSGPHRRSGGALPRGVAPVAECRGHPRRRSRLRPPARRPLRGRVERRVRMVLEDLGTIAWGPRFSGAAMEWRADRRPRHSHRRTGHRRHAAIRRYVPLVAAQARAILEVPAPLAPLLSRLPGNAAIAVRGASLPPVRPALSAADASHARLQPRSRRSRPPFRTSRRPSVAATHAADIAAVFERYPILRPPKRPRSCRSNSMAKSHAGGEKSEHTQPIRMPAHARNHAAINGQCLA